jgi:hypothetical protein
MLEFALSVCVEVDFRTSEVKLDRERDSLLEPLGQTAWHEVTLLLPTVLV